MSILGKTPTHTTAAAESETPMLTPEQVVEELRILRARIPEFVQLPKDRQLKQIRRLAQVNADFAREAINTVGASDVVQTAIGNSAEDLHAAADEAARWSAVESELNAMLRGVTAANLVRRQRIGKVALQAYRVSRALVQQPDHADLLPHVDSMTRLPKYGRRRAKPAVEATKPV